MPSIYLLKIALGRVSQCLLEFKVYEWVSEVNVSFCKVPSYAMQMSK